MEKTQIEHLILVLGNTFGLKISIGKPIKVNSSLIGLLIQAYVTYYELY